MRPDHCTFAKRSSSKILRRVTSEIAFMSANIALLRHTQREIDGQRVTALPCCAARRKLRFGGLRDIAPCRVTSGALDIRGHGSNPPLSSAADPPSSASRQSGLLELPPERTPLVPLPPLAITDRFVPDLGHNKTRVDYLSACGRLLALCLATVGLIADATFGASMGITVWQRTLYAV